MSPPQHPLRRQDWGQRPPAPPGQGPLRGAGGVRAGPPPRHPRPRQKSAWHPVSAEEAGRAADLGRGAASGLGAETPPVRRAPWPTHVAAGLGRGSRRELGSRQSCVCRPAPRSESVTRAGKALRPERTEATGPSLAASACWSQHAARSAKRVWGLCVGMPQGPLGHRPLDLSLTCQIPSRGAESSLPR